MQCAYDGLGSNVILRHHKFDVCIAKTFLLHTPHAADVWFDISINESKKHLFVHLER